MANCFSCAIEYLALISAFGFVCVELALSWIGFLHDIRRSMVGAGLPVRSQNLLEFTKRQHRVS